MKLFSTLAFSVMALTLSANEDMQLIKAKKDTSKNTAPSMPRGAESVPVKRKFKESEVGLGYTFSRVNLGGLNQMPVFVDYAYENTFPDNERYTFKNFKMQPAYEFNLAFIQRLDTPDVKVFLDANYIHADGVTHAYLPAYDGTDQSTALNPMFSNDLYLDYAYDEIQTTSDNYPYYGSVKTHFDLASAQAGVSKRLYRTKNIDFSVFGGADVAFFTTEMKINLFGRNYNNSSYYTYVKTSENVRVLADTDTMTPTELAYAAPGQSAYTRNFKTRYYGTGPLLGANLQVPFDHDFLRLNIKLEASALMGYGTSYLLYDSAGIAMDDLYQVSTVTSRQRHTFRMVPTLRGEMSMDIIIKNCVITAGLQQQVYFQAMDINPLVDLAEYQNDAGNFTASTTRDRLGQLVTGGPFLKASILF